ncbi:MAG: glycosyltransferase [Oscillospiraceae bacterium]|jgi:glycosyltransferase involved in cell wall biosynthesis|nr:glycosyltransferase [Oscillospiraceae bacterium]
MAKRRIIFTIASLAPGGAEMVLTRLVNALDPERFAITVRVLDKGGALEERLAANIRLEHILCSADYYAGGWKRFIYRMKSALLFRLPPCLSYLLFLRGKADVEIAFCENAPVRLISGSRQKSRKVTWLHCNPVQLPFAKNLFRNAEAVRKAYRRFDEICCVSQGTLEAFRSLYGADLPLRVVYNPIDAAEIRALAAAGVPEATAPKEGFTLIALGRLHPVKRFDRLLLACARLKAEGIPFQCLIVGEGECRWALEKQRESLCLMEQAELPGYSTNPYPLLAAADLFVCTSDTEGFSTAATEALTLGVPVLTTDNGGGMHELLDGYDCGRICPNTDEGFAEELLRLLRNPEQIQWMRANACKRAEAFNAAQTISEISRIIEGSI